MIIVWVYTEILPIMAFQWGLFLLKKILLQEPNMHGQQSSLQVNITSLSIPEVKKCGAPGCFEVT